MDKKIYLLIVILGMSGSISLPLIGQVYFEINNFEAHLDELKILGDVFVKDQKMNLTPDESNQIGACWYTKKRIDLSKGFETEFTFLITKKNGNSNHGDGFAFVVQNESPGALGAGGPGLGYDGIHKALVLEFDTYDNEEGSKNHVNISYFSQESKRFKKLATVHQIPEITDGDAHFARIEYKKGVLTFYLDSYIFPILSTKVDLEQITESQNEGVWLGFTASTSSSSSMHSLLSWSVNEKLHPPDFAIADIKIIHTKTIRVKSQKLKIKVWDDNKIDGDIISLKSDDDWIFTELELKKAPKEINLTLTGFSTILTLFANNIGLVPPNTAAISIHDGVRAQKINLNADLQTSESVEIIYEPGS